MQQRESLKKFVTYKKWVETVIQKESEDKNLLDDEEDEKEDGESKERKEVRILSKKVARGKVLEALHSKWAMTVITHQHQMNIRACV